MTSSTLNHFKSCYIASNRSYLDKLHYVYGPQKNPSAPLMIFLHGFPENSFAWSEFLPYFFAAGFQVIALDLRGFFLSNTEQNTNSLQMSSFISDVKRLCDKHKACQTVIVGHDLGGTIAWAFSEKHPELCDAMIVFNTAHPAAYYQLFKRNPLLFLRQNLRLWYAFFFQLPWLPEWLMRKKNFLWMDYVFKKWIHKPLPNLNLRLNFYKRCLSLKGALYQSIQVYRANVFSGYGRSVLYPYFLKNKFKPINVPALVLWGEKDSVLENSLAEELQPFCHAGLDLHKFKLGGHWLHHEYVEESQSIILKFLKEKKISTILSDDNKSFEDRVRLESNDLMTLFNELLCHVEK